MEFLDSNHRVFSLRSYEDNPIGYEYHEQPYVFWVNKDDRSFLSINNYYIHTIYCLVDLSLHDINDIHITISLDSNVYTLINTQVMNDAINNMQNIHDNINLETLIKGDDDEYVSMCVKELSSDNAIDGKEDIVGVKIKENNIEYLLVPIYILCKAEECGAWLSNILIHVNTSLTDEYCPITIGGEFNEVYENLVIHGENMGVKLPKDILRAVYNNSYYDTEFDEGLYNEKLKEYLLNYYNIKANQGNNQSLLNSLKWFGWGDNLSIKSLFNMSNEYINQYLIKGFDLYNTDFLYTYNKFLRSSLIKLYIKINTEKKDDNNDVVYNKQNYHGTGFIGEGNPEMIDLDSTYKYVENYDYYNDDYYIDEETGEYIPFVENIPYIKSFYNFTLQELSLKLLLLKYYLNQYFLPVHVSIHSAVLQHKVYTNDIKMKNVPAIYMHGGVYSNEDTNIDVQFDGDGHYFFHKQLRIIDQYFNEFDIAPYYDETDAQYHFPKDKDLFYLYDTCLNIPITFKSTNDTQYYDCSLFIEKENEDTDIYSYENVIRSNNSFNIIDDIIIINNDNNTLYYDEDLNDGKFVYSYNIHTNTNTNYSYNIYYDSIDDVKTAVINRQSNNKLTSIDNPSNTAANTVVNYTSFEYIDDHKQEYYNVVNSLYADVNHKYVYNDMELWFIKSLSKKNNDITYYTSALFSKYTENQTAIYKLVEVSESSTNIYINDDIVLNINDIDSSNGNAYVMSFKTCPSFSLNIKSNFRNISLYKINKDYINEMLANKDLLIKLNIYTQSYKNKIKVLINNLYYTKQIKEIETRYVDIMNSHLVYESHFQFIQNDTNIYKNFILCPKFLTVKNSTYYQYGNFTIKLLCNNKWFYHEFTTDMTDLVVDLGKLQYQYYNESNNITSHFNQLNTLDADNNQIEFNVFMHNNDLVKTYNSMYPVDIYKRYCEENRVYIGLEDIPDDFLLYYIIVNGIKVYLSQDLYNSSKDIYIPFVNTYVGGNNVTNNITNNIIDYIRPAHKFNEVIMAYDNKCIVKISGDIDTAEIPTYQIYDVELNNNNDETDENRPYVRLYRSNLGFNITNEESDIVDFKIYENLNKLNLFDKYRATFNIPKLAKYQNEVAVFDLKESKTETIDLFEYYNNIHMSLNGIMFNTDVTDNKKIVISGKLFDDDDDDRYVYDDTTKDNADIYSVLSNKTAPNLANHTDDALQLINIKRDDVYVYYVDKNMGYQTEPYSTLDKNMGYIIISTQEELDKFINVKGEQNIILTNENGDAVSYTIINNNINKQNELYVITEGLNKHKIIVDQEYLYSTNQIKLTLHYSFISYNFPRYIYGNENITTDNGNLYTTIDDNTVQVVPIDYIEYHDVRNDSDIKDSPSMLWFKIDLGDVTEKIERSLDKQYIIDDTNNNLSVSAMTINDLKQGLAEDDHEISYINYLEYDLSRYKGEFTFTCTYSDNLIVDGAPVINAVIDINGTVTDIITNDPDSNTVINIDIKSPTDYAKLYFRINIDAAKNIDFNDDLYYIIPHLIKTSVKYKDVLYNENYEIPLNYNVNILDTESLQYPEGVNDNIVNLYSEFFENNEIKLDSTDPNSESITFVEAKQWCTFNNVSIDHDLYLMHDNYKWFCVYISRNTLDHYRKYRNLNINKPQDIYSDDKKYKLEFVKSSNNFLINRYKYISAEGNNEFNKDDVVCGLVLNNDRLPVNFDMACKWNIARQSLSHVKSEFTINQNMGILSFLNDNEYRPGYYDVTVRYTLDNNSAQQRIKKMIMKIK